MYLADDPKLVDFHVSFGFIINLDGFLLVSIQDNCCEDFPTGRSPAQARKWAEDQCRPSDRLSDQEPNAGKFKTAVIKLKDRGYICSYLETNCYSDSRKLFTTFENVSK